MNLRTETRALVRCFYFHPGNSNAQKVALYVAIGVWGLGALGVLLGVVTLDTPDKVTVFTTLTGVMTYLFGRTHGKEVSLLK